MFSSTTGDNNNHPVSLLASELVAFCLSDLSLSRESSIAGEVGRALGGLRLIPTKNNTLVRLPRERQRLPLNDVLVLTTTRRQHLLIPDVCLVHDSFIATISKHIPRLGFGEEEGENTTDATNVTDATDDSMKGLQTEFLHSVGISMFTPEVLAAHISKVLPAEWRNQLIVKWSPNALSKMNDEIIFGGSGGGRMEQPTMGWLKMFWSEININNINDVRMFDSWPLIPLKEMELMSCSLMECGLVTKEHGGKNGNIIRKRAEEEETKLLKGGNEGNEGNDADSFSKQESVEEEDIEAEVSF